MILWLMMCKSNSQIQILYEFSWICKSTYIEQCALFWVLHWQCSSFVSRQPVGFSYPHQLTVMFTYPRCKKGNKHKAVAGPHMNPVKTVMKLLQCVSFFHLVPKYQTVAVKDTPWQRLINAYFCRSLIKSKGLQCGVKTPPVTARWTSHGPTERIMHRCLERWEKKMHVSDLHCNNLQFYFSGFSFMHFYDHVLFVFIHMAGPLNPPCIQIASVAMAGPGVHVTQSSRPTETQLPLSRHPLLLESSFLSAGALILPLRTPQLHSPLSQPPSHSWTSLGNL